MTKSQMRGYLYEVLISHLLVQNNFKKCRLDDRSMNCGLVSRDGEIQGRGTRHQIDFVGVYTHYIPFVFPLRLLAECKFWKKKVDKSFIRAKPHTPAVQSPLFPSSLITFCFPYRCWE